MHRKLKDFGDCLVSHVAGQDGVLTVKDAYGDYVEKTAPCTDWTAEVMGFLGFRK